MRNMSFAYTVRQVQAREKTVTRRFGWKNLKPGESVRAVAKSQGLKHGEHPEELAIIRCLSNRREPVDDIILNEGWSGPRKEGFEGYTPEQFVEIFCLLNHCMPDTVISRIEFEYVD